VEHSPPRQAVNVAPRVVLTADDFGLSEGIDEGILHLLAGGRLAALSVLSGAPRWRADGPRLGPYRSAVDIGLHFSLTEVPTFRAAGLRRGDGAAFTFREVQAAAWRGRIKRAAVVDELRLQWQAFADVLGQAPSHIDSHQHVHQLPVIRDALLEFVDGLPAEERPYVRTAVERTGTILRRGVQPGRAFAFSLAGRALRHGLAARRCRTNDGFTGVYDFRAPSGYRPLFQRFVRAARDTTILLCHPSVPGSRMPDDPIAPAREQEFAYLSSAGMAEDLAAAGVRIGRFG
jgi:predicted glycoside hydrolase/deacetylase ChbG (UPF0249 family)